jgi:hypothetical protein
MAKRKHATALFEVYRRTVQTESGKPGFRFRAPKWLSRSKGDVDSSQSLLSVVDEPAPVSMPERSVRMEIPDDEVDTSHSRPGVRIAIDSLDQTISLILSYGSAAVVCFTVVVMLGLAFVMGRHSGRGPLPLLAERTTEEVRLDKPRADVLDVGRDASNAPITPTKTVPTPASMAKPSPKPQTWNDPRPPSTYVAKEGQRVIGLNYVIIQSYPDQADAENAMKLLEKRGIECTVEPAPASWSHSAYKMYSVIGKLGFDRIRNSPEFEQYKDAILKVSDEFAGRSKFKRFDPSPFKWVETK